MYVWPLKVTVVWYAARGPVDEAADEEDDEDDEEDDEDDDEDEAEAEDEAELDGATDTVDDVDEELEGAVVELARALEAVLLGACPLITVRQISTRVSSSHAQLLAASAHSPATGEPTPSSDANEK
jgi:hypothetical protein